MEQENKKNKKKKKKKEWVWEIESKGNAEAIINTKKRTQRRRKNYAPPQTHMGDTCTHTLYT